MSIKKVNLVHNTGVAYVIKLTKVMKMTNIMKMKVIKFAVVEGSTRYR